MSNFKSNIAIKNYWWLLSKLYVCAQKLYSCRFLHKLILSNKELTSRDRFYILFNIYIKENLNKKQY